MSLAKLKRDVATLYAAGLLAKDAASTIYSNLLQRCLDVGAMKEATQIQLHMIKYRHCPSLYLRTKILILYVKLGLLQDARQLFDRMSQRNTVTWNSMMSAYANAGQADQVFELFSEMQDPYFPPDRFTLACLLRACSIRGQNFSGRNCSHVLCMPLQIHARIIKCGLQFDTVLMATLIDAFSKCEEMEHARRVFDEMSEKNVVSWTALITGYANSGNFEEALVKLQAMPVKDVVAWNAIMEGYVQHEMGDEALEVFVGMLRSGLRPSVSTFLSVFSACSSSNAGLEQGKQCHAYLIKACFCSETVTVTVMLNSALLDMYAKCGSLDMARQVFDVIPRRNVVSWTAMIDALGRHGHAAEAMECFRQMLSSGTRPNSVTFLSILCACSHGCLLKQGWEYFHSMSRVYGLVPEQQHYACMVDLLGRAGRLSEALDFIDGMPVEPGADVWGALLGACKVYGDTKLAQYAAEQLFRLNDRRPGSYVALANIYAASGRWADASRVRKAMRDRGVDKEPGYSSIEVNRWVHTFYMED